jgi:O-antigen/teichoic acid export membrane protein
LNIKLVSQKLIIYGCGNVLLRAAQLMLIPLYTHTLSINDYGLLATILITIQIFTIVIDLGTRTGLIRFAAEYERENQIGCLLGSTFLINIASGFIVTSLSLLFLLPFFQNIFHGDQIGRYVFLACGAALMQCLYINLLTYYRARNEGMKYLIASSSAFILLVAFNLFFLLFLHRGIEGALIAHILAYGGLWLVLLIMVVSKTGLRVSSQLQLKLFRFGFPLVFAMSGDYVTDVSIMYFLSYYTDLEQVAIYSLGGKIAQITTIALIIPFQLAYEPFVYANVNAPWIRGAISKLLTYLILCFAFVAFGTAFFSRDLLRIIAPPNYSSAYLILLLILPGIAFRGVYYIGESLLNVKNKTFITGATVTIATILSIGSSCVLIPIWGIYGAITVFNMTVLSTALALMIFGMKTFPIQIEGRRLGMAGVLSICFLLSVFFLREIDGFIYHSLLPIIALVGLAFLYFGNFFDDEEKSLIRGVFQRIRLAIST